MALEIFKLFGSVFVDNTKANESLSKTEEKAGGLAKGFSNAAKKIAAVAATYLTTTAIVNFGKQCISAASDVEEMENKFSVVFGDLSDEVDQWATNYAKSIGRNKNTIKTWLADNQNMFVGMGMTREEGAKLSEQMVSLGLDLASFNNLSEPEAVEKLSKALMGETESAKSLGAVLNENTIALAQEQLGYQGKFEALTEAQKMEVRYQAILNQSQDAIGDCERSMGSYKSSVTMAQSAIESIQEKIGAFLLPVATDMVARFAEAATTLSENLDPALETLEGWLDDVGQGVTALNGFLSEHETALILIGIAIATLTTAYGAYTAAQAISNAGGIVAIATSTAETVALYGMIAAETAATVATTALSAAVAFLTSPVTLVIVAIGALVAAGVLLYKNWDTVKSKATELGNGVKNTFNNMLSGVKTIWNNVTSTITRAIDTAKSKVKTGVDAIKGFFSFKFSWPKLPMPHFAVKPSGWKIGDLLKGTVPSLGVSWYAKAYQNPVLLDSPTIFGAAGGRLLGGGDGHGAELVGGEQRVRSMIRSAVSEGMEGGGYSEIVEILLAILQWLKDNPPPQGGGYGPRDMDRALGRLYNHAVRGV